MVFSFEERPTSRRQTLNPPTLILEYVASGEHDDLIVSAHAEQATPVVSFISTGKVYRQDITLDPVGHSLYNVTITYGPRQRETGSYSFTFDTTGGTARVTTARQHIASYPQTGDQNPHRGSIGVTPEGAVEGVDITIPGLKYSFTFRQPQGVVTLPYTRLLARATGMMNGVRFLDFDPYELLFLGATGSDGREQEAEVTFHILASENATDLTYGDISGIAKAGHDYLWVEFESHKDDDGRQATKPRRVHIDRLFQPADFATLFGWGGPNA